MPLSEEEKRWLAQTLGTAPSAPAPARPAPGTLPPDIAGVAYPASLYKKGLRINIPPPASEIRRQLEVNKLKQDQKPPKPLSAKQQDAIDGLLGTSATLKELVGMLQKNPKVETGLLHPSFQRNFVGDVARSFSKPEVTQISQVSNRMQDAYRRYVTGVQAGFQEVASFLPSSIPNPATLPKDKYLAAIDTFSREVERSKEPLRRAMKLRGYSEEQVQEMFAPLATLSELPSATESAGGDPYVAEARRRGLIK